MPRKALPISYAGFEARVVPENVTLLAKTKDQATDVPFQRENPHRQEGDTIQSILRDLGATPGEAQAIANNLGAAGREGAA